jgi:hypothetical protein
MDNYLISLRVLAAAGLHRLFTDAEDQAHFRQMQQPLLVEARATLAQAGQAEQGVQMEHLFPTPDQVRQDQEELLRKKARQSWRLGMALAVAELGVAVAAGPVLGSLYSTARWGATREVLSLWLTNVIFLGLWAALALLTGLTAILLRRFPFLARHGGGLVLILAMLPWLGIPIFMLIMLFGGID